MNERLSRDDELQGESKVTFPRKSEVCRPRL